MSFTLRRSQSLKSLSAGHSSWIWDRKTPVSQLVQRYESCVDLTNAGREDSWSKPSGLRRSNHEESKVENLWRRYESLSGANAALSRSISMDMLPPPDLMSTNTATGMFESKSSPRPQLAAQTKNSSMWREKSYSGATAVTSTSKHKAHQVKSSEPIRRRTVSGVSGYISRCRSSTELNDDKRHFKKDWRESASYPEYKQKYTSSPITSVKDRSALYLLKVAAADSSGSIEQQGSVVHERFNSSGTTKKGSKFLSPAKEMCSACLMPVYPMEKMVADKLILHMNCFCCKYCNKKLSIHNCSALYGEFYCSSHYQQLFKKKGNYDEGFGHRQHKDRWLVKTEEPELTNKSSSARKVQPPCVDGVLPSHQRHRDDKFSSNENNTKLRISWPPENKKTRHSPISQSSSSVSKRTTDWSNHGFSSAQNSRNALEKKRFNSRLDEVDKSVQMSTRVYEKTDKMKGGVKTLHKEPVYTKPAHKAANISGVQNKVSKEETVSRRHDSLKGHGLAEDRNLNNPAKIKKAVRFASTDEKNNTEFSTEEAERSTEVVVEPAIVTTMFNSETEMEESPEESLIDTMQDLHSSDSVKHPKSTDGQTQDPFLQAAEMQGSVVSVSDDAHFSEMKTIPNPDELQVNDLTELESSDESCTQILEMKDKVVIETNANVESANNVESLEIRHESKNLDLFNMPPKPDDKSNKKVADKKATDKGNKGSWSKGKSPLSKLFPVGSSKKENKSEAKTESKRADVKPRNLLSRLFSATEVESEIKKAPETKTCEKEPEKIGGKDNGRSGLEDHISVSLVETTSQSTPEESIKPTQNVLNDAPEELNPIESCENPILLPKGSSAEETASSFNLGLTEQLEPASGVLGEIDPSQENIHLDIFSQDNSSTVLQENLNSSLPKNEEQPGILDTPYPFTSQATSPNTDILAFADSDPLDFTNTGTFADIVNVETPPVDKGSSFNQADPFEGQDEDLTLQPSENENTLNIFGASEPKSEVNSYDFPNTMTEGSKKEPTDDPFGINSAPMQAMDIFGGENMLTVSDQTSTSDIFDIMTNSESQSQSPFEGATDAQQAPSGLFDLITSEGEPSTLSASSNALEQKSSDPGEENLIQSEVANVFDSKNNLSASTMLDQNLSDQGVIQSSQPEAFDFFSSDPDSSTAMFSVDPFSNDIFTNVTDAASTNAFSVETVQKAVNLFDDFTGIEGVETKSSSLFPDDIFSSIPASSPEAAQDQTNTALPQKPENDWMSDFLG